MSTPVREARRLPVASRADARVFAWRALRSHRGGLTLMVAVVVAGVLAGLVVPPVLGWIVDRIVDEQPVSALLLPLGVLAVAATVEVVLSGWGYALIGAVGERALADAREEVVEVALSQPLETIERTDPGDLVARVSNDVEAVSSALREAIPVLVTSVLTVALTIGGLALLDWRLALAGCVSLPWYLWAGRLYGVVSPPLYAAERRAEGDREQQVVAALEGVDTIVALDLGERHLFRIRAASLEARRRTIRALRASAWFFTRIHLGEFSGVAAILVVGALLVQDGQITAGAATAAALYFLRLFDPIGGLILLLDEAQSATAALARLAGVAGLGKPRHGDAPPPSGGGIELREVSFAYVDGPDVIRGIDLTVAPGECVAVVGTSGAGKSTLASIVAGIHEAREGRVVVDGLDTARVDRDRLAEHVTFVDQEPHVFSGSLREDLRLARAEADDEALWSVLRAVGADRWVSGLAEGLDTAVGDGGVAFDAMQTMQVALARCLLRETPVVIVDEPTADVGGRQLKPVESAIRAVVEGRTALIVAHRLSTAATADRVVVMSEGRVVEDGPPSVLASSDGYYARLLSAWRVSTGS